MELDDDLKKLIAETIVAATTQNAAAAAEAAAQARAVFMKRLMVGFKGVGLVIWTLAMLVVGHTL